MFWLEKSLNFAAPCQLLTVKLLGVELVRFYCITRDKNLKSIAHFLRLAKMEGYSRLLGTNNHFSLPSLRVCRLHLGN